MENIFETHAHYDDEAFDEDRENLLEELPKRGVCGVITAGADLKSSVAAINLAEKYSYIYAAVGIHPENISDIYPCNADDGRNDADHRYGKEHGRKLIHKAEGNTHRKSINGCCDGHDEKFLKIEFLVFFRRSLFTLFLYGFYYHL